MTFIWLFFVVVLICVSGCSTLTNGVMIPQSKPFLRRMAIGPTRSLTSPLHSTTTSSLEVTAGEADKKVSLNKPLLSAALSLSYMSIIVSIMSLPIALGALNADKAFFGGAKSTYLSQMLATATLATGMAKFLLGPPTDKFGGANTLNVTMLMVALLLQFMAVSPNVLVFGRLWIVLSFVYAAAWGACGKIVRENFRADEWSRELGLLATGSRIGSMGSSLLFGGLLVNNGWRTLFQVASAIQVTTLVAFALLYKSVVVGKSPAASTSSTRNVVTTAAAKSAGEAVESIPMVLKRVMRNPIFWLMLLGKMSLMCVGQFISFMPLYLQTGFAMPSPQAAAASSLFALGSLTSSLLLIPSYQKMTSSWQGKTIAGLNLFNFVLPGLLWAHHAALIALPNPTTIVPALLFLWGASWMLPFYVPPGVYALHLGGVQHSALLTNMFDAAGFTAGAVLSYFAMSLGSKGHWKPVLGALSCGGGLALMGMWKAMASLTADTNTKTR